MIAGGLYFVFQACQPKPVSIDLEKKVEKLSNLQRSLSSYITDTISYKKFVDSIKTSHTYQNDKDIQYLIAMNVEWEKNVQKKHNHLELYLDSIINDNHFRELNFLNKFYTYSKMAYVKSRNMKPLESMENFKKADSLLSLYPFPLEVERRRIKIFFLRNTGLSTNSFEAVARYYVKELEMMKGNSEMDKRNQVHLAYSIGYYFLNAKNYPNARKYFQKSLNLIKGPKANFLYTETMGDLFQYYRATDQIDSIQILYSKLENDYDNNILTEVQINQVRSFMAQFGMGAIPDYQMDNLIQEALNYYGDNCNENYYIYKLYQGKALQHEKRKQERKARNAWITSLHFIKNCVDMNEYYAIEELKTLEALIQLNDKGETEDQLRAWVERTSEINNSMAANIEVLNNLQEYFWDKEMRYIEKKNTSELQKNASLKRQKWALIIGAIIAFCAFFYILCIYFKNRRNVSKIQQNNTLQNEKKKLIVSQQENLESLIQNLDESNRKLKKFAEVVAQDFQLPIAKIHNNTAILAQKYIDQVEKEDVSVLKFLEDSTQQLNAMIEILLHFSDKNKKIIKDEKVDLNIVIQEVLGNLQEAIQQTQAKIFITRDLPQVKANKMMVVQLFQNLISNSLKFHKQGVPPNIYIGLQGMKEGYCHLYIKDNGIGIPENDLERIFSFHSRTEDIQTYEGNGIGLSIVKKVIEEFEGEITVESMPNIGSTFYFTLPHV